MKVVILAGGYGTRISEESHLRPKPMIEIGGKPILWHIMKEYSYHGFNEFIICAGYKQQVIKEWFANYYLHMSDITFDFTDQNKMEIHTNAAEPWKVTIVDTGLDTMTGGRIKRIQSYIGNETFMLTYGDGVSDVDIHKLLEYHNAHKSIVTLTSVSVGQKFGTIDISSDGKVTAFREKNDLDGATINAGYMIVEPEIFDYIDGDQEIFEKKPLERLAEDGLLNAYSHSGFWKCMDTQRDKQQLEKMIAEGSAPWMRWKG